MMSQCEQIVPIRQERAHRLVVVRHNSYLAVVARPGHIRYAMEDFHERLRQAVHDRFASEAEFARDVGLLPRRTNHYLTGRSEPGLKLLVRMCRAVGKTPNQLLGFDSIEPVPDDGNAEWISVDQWVGGLPSKTGQRVGSIQMNRAWLAGIVADQSSLGTVALLVVSGDAMAPTIANGNQVLVDFSRRKVQQDGIYVFDVDGEPLIRRVAVDVLRQVGRVLTDNAAYGGHGEPQGTPLKKLAPIGQVVWLARRVA